MYIITYCDDCEELCMCNFITYQMDENTYSIELMCRWCTDLERGLTPLRMHLLWSQSRSIRYSYRSMFKEILRLKVRDIERW